MNQKPWGFIQYSVIDIYLIIQQYVLNSCYMKDTKRNLVQSFPTGFPHPSRGFKRKKADNEYIMCV